MKCLVEFLKDQRGVTLVEYGIAITLALSIGSAVFAALAADLNSSVNAAGALMPQ